MEVGSHLPISGVPVAGCRVLRVVGAELLATRFNRFNLSDAAVLRPSQPSRSHYFCERLQRHQCVSRVHIRGAPLACLVGIHPGRDSAMALLKTFLPPHSTARYYAGSRGARADRVGD